MKTENKSNIIRQYRGYNNFVPRIKDLEPGGGQSETIQDDSYTIREIMEKFTIHGTPIEEGQELAQYQDEVTHDSPDLRRVQAMDLVDRDEVYADVLERQNIASQKIIDWKNKIDEENATKIREHEEQESEKEDQKAKRSESKKIAQTKTPKPNETE
ncbi:MAG: hypothetical protein [Microvirus sp.]|nr:MAG: hypothetical protein [Microvirus sp.]